MRSLIIRIIVWFVVIVLLGAAGYFIEGSWLGMLALPAAVVLALYLYKKAAAFFTTKSLFAKLSPKAPVLTTEDGFEYRDLNKNGKLDIYEDVRQPIDARVEDLLSQMTVEEKAGMMFSPTIGYTKENRLHRKGGVFAAKSVLEVVAKKKINTFACINSAAPYKFARWYNECQTLAEQTRLGIPVMLCSDPRHSYVGENNPLATLMDAGVSSWPTPIGFGAIGDEQVMLEYGNVARKELRAIGVSFALHPTADTATEPRWPRLKETFGENAELNAKLVSAYIQGFQGEQLDKTSIACCVKHFPGGGPQKNGDDPHFPFGKEQVYPGGMFEHHLQPFKKAFKAGVAAVMPYYGIPTGLEGIEEVGFNFNKTITHDLLRETLQFEGVVHTDYGILTDSHFLGIRFGARCWGVEHLDTKGRLLKAIEAGVDQIGGEYCPELLVDLVREKLVSQERLDVSCRRILRLKFQLGLFDTPFVSPEKAAEICACEPHVQAGEQAMRRSLVLIKNDKAPVMLPLSKNLKVYISGFTKAAVAPYATLVKRPQDADVALVRLDAPYRKDKRDTMTMMFKGLDLDYTDKQKAKLQKIMDACPTIVSIEMVRPAVIPEIVDNAAGILAEFGAKEKIVLEAIFGAFSPSGKLPFDLPSSKVAVEAQRSDVPFDTKDPLFKCGFGLQYDDGQQEKEKQNAKNS